MDKNMLEFWGHAFLNAARSQQQWEEMNKLFGPSKENDNYSALGAFFKSLGWPKADKMNPEEIAELVKKSVNVFQEFSKFYLNLFDVVSKEEHLKLLKENEELKDRIAQLEKVNDSYQNMSLKSASKQDQGMENLTQIMENQAQQFQELMKQINLFYKKEKQTKKK